MITKRNELIRCQWIEDLVSRRNEVKSLVSDAMAMLERASSLTPGTIGLSSVSQTRSGIRLPTSPTGSHCVRLLLKLRLVASIKKGGEN